jgi:hypothetical protein
MNWDAVGAIAGVISIFLVILIEWEVLSRRFGLVASWFPSLSKRNQNNTTEIKKEKVSLSNFDDWSAFWGLTLVAGGVFLFLGLISSGIRIETPIDGAVKLGMILLFFGLTPTVIEFNLKTLKKDLPFLLGFPIIMSGTGAILGFLMGFVNNSIINILSGMPSIQGLGFTLARSIIWFFLGLVLGLCFNIILIVTDTRKQ